MPDFKPYPGLFPTRILQVLIGPRDTRWRWFVSSALFHFVPSYMLSPFFLDLVGCISDKHSRHGRSATDG